MSFLPDQDGLVHASLETAQTAPTVLWLGNFGMPVEPEIHFSDHMLRADRYTGPTRLAAVGIQADKTGFRVAGDG
jgi:hypothetical protein